MIKFGKMLNKLVKGRKYVLRSKPKYIDWEHEKKMIGIDDEGRLLEYIENDFVDNRDGTITDEATGLMWQKDGSDQVCDYRRALKYSDELNNGRFAGYADWRIPTIDELKSLIEPVGYDFINEMGGYKHTIYLAIDPIFKVDLHNPSHGEIWSCDKRSAKDAWTITIWLNKDMDFIEGRVSANTSSLNATVKAVRTT